MEVTHKKYEQMNLTPIANGQIKVNAHLVMQPACKKVLNVSANCFISATERIENEVRVQGKVVTRVIFIDENDGLNSEDHTDNWTEKFIIKTPDAISVVPTAYILESQAPTQTKDENGFTIEVNTAHIIDVVLLGNCVKEVPYVSDVDGNVEVKAGKTSVSTFDETIVEKFEIGETFTLDGNIDGILGVELYPFLRDISCADGKISIKGTASANVTGVKSTDSGTTLFNTYYDWDFTKTIQSKDVEVNDSISGGLSLSNVNVKIENNDKPEMVIDAELLFTGHRVISREIETIEDAFCFDNALSFIYTDVENVQMTPQINFNADIEGNIAMPEGSPFIGKVLSVSSTSVDRINVVALDGKAMIEGIFSAQIVYECEEKIIHSHIIQMPFSTPCKIESCSTEHNISVYVVPTICKIRARRGKELLVDAKLAISATAHILTKQKIITDATLGAEKIQDESAITIHIATEHETLWDIAKSMNVSCDEIIKQNPSATNGIAEGDRILLYKKQAINF